MLLAGNWPSNSSIFGSLFNFPSFLWNALELIFWNFLAGKKKNWLLVGWLWTHHQIQAFKKVSWSFTIFYQETSKFGYRTHCCELVIKCTHFRNFLEIFLLPAECSRAEFLHFCTKNCLISIIGWTTGNSPSNLSISGVFLKFPNFLWNVLELIFSNFLPKNNKIWLLGWRLGTRHQIQAFKEFSWNFVISCQIK